MNKLKTRRNGISLRLSLSSAFVITVVVTTIVLGICTFISVRNFVRSEIQQRLATAVGIAAIQIEADKHATLKTKDDEKGQVYVDYQQKLRRIRDSSKDIRYVYTFRKQADGKIVFVVDAEEPSDKFSHIGDPYESPTSVLMESFKPPYQVRVESEFSKTTGEFGCLPLLLSLIETETWKHWWGWTSPLRRLLSMSAITFW